MLGVLLTILKIIGIILLVLLALILGLASVILLVPIRYRGKAVCQEKKFSGNLKITWLLHLLSASVSVTPEENDIRVKVLGKTIYPKKKKSAKEPQAKVPEISDIPKDPKPPLLEESALGERVEAVYEPQIDQPKESKEPKETADGQIKEKEQRSEAQAETKVQEKTQQMAESGPQENPRAEFKQKPERKKKNPVEMLKEKIRVLKQSFQSLKTKLQNTKNKADYWKKLLLSDSMKEAAAKLLGTGKALLRHILPQKLTGYLHFGFDDPSMTGKILAYLSVIYPFTQDHLVIEPEFEETILEGNIAFRGRIRLGYLLYLVLTVIFNKNIRRQYKRLRKGGNKDGEGSK